MPPPKDLIQELVDDLNSTQGPLRAQIEREAAFRLYNISEIERWLRTDVIDQLWLLGVTDPAQLAAAQNAVLSAFLNFGDEPRTTAAPRLFVQPGPDRARGGLAVEAVPTLEPATLAAVTDFIRNEEADAFRWPNHITRARRKLAFITALRNEGFISPEVANSLSSGNLRPAFDRRAGRDITVDEQAAYLDEILANFDEVQARVAGFGGGDFENAAEQFAASQIAEAAREDGPRPGQLIVRPMAETLEDVQARETQAAFQAATAGDVVDKPYEEFLNQLRAAGLPTTPDQVSDDPATRAAFTRALNAAKDVLLGTKSNLQSQVAADPASVADALRDLMPGLITGVRESVTTAAEGVRAEAAEESFTENRKAIESLTPQKVKELFRTTPELLFEPTDADAQSIADLLKLQVRGIDEGQPVPTAANAILGLPGLRAYRVNARAETEREAQAEIAERRGAEAKVTAQAGADRIRRQQQARATFAQRGQQRRAFQQSDQGILRFLAGRDVITPDSTPGFIGSMLDRAQTALARASVFDPDKDPSDVLLDVFGVRTQPTDARPIAEPGLLGTRDVQQALAPAVGPDLRGQEERFNIQRDPSRPPSPPGTPVFRRERPEPVPQVGELDILRGARTAVEGQDFLGSLLGAEHLTPEQRAEFNRTQQQGLLNFILNSANLSGLLADFRSEPERRRQESITSRARTRAEAAARGETVGFNPLGNVAPADRPAFRAAAAFEPLPQARPFPDFLRERIGSLRERFDLLRGPLSVPAPDPRVAERERRQKLRGRGLTIFRGAA